MASNQEDSEQSQRALADLVGALRLRAYSERTVQSYYRWARRFLSANRGVPLAHLRRGHVERFLARLAEKDRLAPKSRNQAASALAFLFREILGRDVVRHVKRAREPKRIPVVLAHRQVRLVLNELGGKYRLLGSLMYGAGLRLLEAHQLRVKDIDFDLGQIAVRDGKGAKDRWAILPDALESALRRQVRRVAELHRQDRNAGGGWVALPGALHRKDPTAGYELGWQFLFPARTMHTDPATGRRGRRHLSPTSIQRLVKRAGRRAGIAQPVSCHTLRRSFATQMLRAGYDVRSVQRLMGHRDVRTTMLYVQAVQDAGIGVRSPLDLDRLPPRRPLPPAED